MARIHVLVVDDHRIFAESLAAALAAEPDVDITAVNHSGQQRTADRRLVWR